MGTCGTQVWSNYLITLATMAWPLWPPDWKAAALPSSYARVADGAGIEPARPKGSRRISIALPYHSANHPCLRERFTFLSEVLRS